MPGIDKAYAVNKFLELNGYTKEDCLFFGDMLYEKGNDYPVYLMGVDCIKVANCQETTEHLNTLYEIMTNGNAVDISALATNVMSSKKSC